MLTIVQSWRLNVIFRKLPAVFILRERPTELCMGRRIHLNRTQDAEDRRSDGPIRRAELRSSPWRHPMTWLKISTEAGSLVSSSQLVVLTLACIVCTSSNCDAVIRRPGRIWGVWESHERNDAMLGNQFLAGDNTSRIRTCFIKQCWL